MEPVFATRLEPRGVSRALRIGLPAFAVGPLAMLWLHTGKALLPLLANGVGVGLILGFLGAVIGLVTSSPRVTEGRLELDGDTLRHGTTRLLHKSEVREGRAWQEAHGAHVLLQAERSTHLVLPRIEDARALLQALGVDATQKAAKFSVVAPSRTHMRNRLLTWLATIPLAVVFAVVCRKGFGFMPPLPLLMAPYLLAVIPMLVPGSVVVGADGLVLRWLWQQRRIPIGDVVSASVVEGESSAGRTPIYLRLVLRGVEAPHDVVVVTPSSMMAEAVQRGRAEVQAIVERIEEARLAHDEGVDLEEAARALAAEGREGSAWLAALRDTFGRADGFRQAAPLTARQLLTVATRPEGPVHVRIAAAAAVAPSLDDAGKARLRVAAEATASPELRVALEAAAAADEEAMAAALEKTRRP